MPHAWHVILSSYVMLWYATSSYVTLCYAMLCYVMLCYIIWCYAMLCYATLFHPLFYHSPLHVILCYVMLCKKVCVPKTGFRRVRMVGVPKIGFRWVKKVCVPKIDFRPPDHQTTTSLYNHKELDHQTTRPPTTSWRNRPAVWMADIVRTPYCRRQFLGNLSKD